MTGAATIQEAITLQQEISTLLAKGCLPLRKWTSNDLNVLQAIPPEHRSNQNPLSINFEETVKTLGIKWHPLQDHFSFDVNSKADKHAPTKRSVLSAVAQIYDPLGWLAPSIVKAKILIQSMWQLRLEWDEELPQHLQNEWADIQHQLKHFEKIVIPRCMVLPESTSFQLHGFCDASEQAYSAVLYIKAMGLGCDSKISLIAAKTRVAPLKQFSLPRLELCGALLLVNLLEAVLTSLPLNLMTLHGWTDSTIVLAWIAAHPKKWTKFVANRVSIIQSTLPIQHWRHVSSEDNPADCASRGIFPSELIGYPLWWSGPKWLLSTTQSDTQIILPSTQLEIRPEKIFRTYAAVIDMSFAHQFSSWNQLLRITAYLRRFMFNCKLPADARSYGPLSVQELHKGKIIWLKNHQMQHFGREIDDLQKNRPFGTRSKLLTLTPFLDEDGLLRVGGRLRAADLHIDKKFPILLPSQGFLTDLIVSSEHLRLLHAGSQLLLSSLGQSFWILRGRDACRRICHRCVICVRHRGETQSQIIGNLPASRVNPGRAFLRCGVDYAGPFLLKVMKGKGQRRFKAYISLFVCFTTKAIHLELVSDLSTSAFLAALKQFTARRGRPQQIWSDCGTNFIGSNREMSDFMKLIRSRTHNDNVSKFLANDQIQWTFNPPAAPHFGGLWESGVKSVKFHLKRAMGTECFNFEEMLTALVQIEACLNSRPLSPMSTDPFDLTSLTPGHFLIGDSLTAVPEANLTNVPLNRLSRWQLTQRVTQHFWKRWSREYLSRLQQRPKWLSTKPDMKEGTLVLVKDDNFPPLKWQMARIVKLHPGSDGHVRVVTVKTANGEFQVPLSKSPFFQQKQQQQLIINML